MATESIAPFVFLAVILYIVVFGGLGTYVSIQKNRYGWEGFWLAVLFGPLGAIIAALLPTGAAETAAAAPVRREADAVTLPAGDWSARGRSAAPVPVPPPAPLPEYVHKLRKLEPAVSVETVPAGPTPARNGTRKP